MRASGRPLKVALVISDLSHGGAERQVIEITKHLDPQRFEVFPISLSNHNPLADEDPELRQRLTVVRKKHKYDVTVPLRLAVVFRRHKIDLVHAFLFDAEIASRVAARIANVQAVIGSERNSGYKVSMLRKMGLKVTNFMVDGIVANSESGANFGAKAYGISRKKYVVVRNGVDLTRFHPRDRQLCRERLGLPVDSSIVGMFASFKRQKNHMLLFDAMEKVVVARHDTTLLLVGDALSDGFGDTNAYKQEVFERLRTSGLHERTVILGKREDVEWVYPACDITVLPSLHEGTPNVVLESLASGVPVIATDVSDNAILIPDGQAGYVVPSGDSRLMSDKILELLNSDETLHEFRSTAFSTAIEEFSIGKMINRMANVYERVHTSVSL